MGRTTLDLRNSRLSAGARFYTVRVIADIFVDSCLEWESLTRSSINISTSYLFGHTSWSYNETVRAQQDDWLDKQGSILASRPCDNLGSCQCGGS